MMTKKPFITTLFIALSLFIAPNLLHADCKFEKIIQADELPIGIMLEWSTCVEELNSMFIIEKSEDGISFINIGAVKGAGTSKSITEYTFLDINAKNDRLYYRLRQIDFDGSFSFSPVLTLQKKLTNNFAVAHMSSVTAVDNFDVEINAYKAGEIEYQLVDLGGKVLDSKKANVQNGSNKISIDLNGYAENIYRLKIKMQSEEEVLTFRKITKEENKKLNFAKSDDCKN